MPTAHQHDLAPWQHAHDFAVDRGATERRAWIVVGITVAMMAAEIGAGWWWGSMALLADGWHMGTHAVAIGVTGLSYWLARRWRAMRASVWGRGRSRCWAPTPAPCCWRWWR